MPRLSSRIEQLHPSPIREILKIIDTPGMVSFAGGLPAPSSFPDVSDYVIDPSMLQYGRSEGETQLREQVAEELRDLGIHTTAERVLILSGSQQGIDLVAKLFIDQGTQVAVEQPTYLAALQSFDFFGAEYQAFQPGMDWKEYAGSGPPALLYCIPTFQNPGAHCYSLNERQSTARWCDANDIVLFEDDPYRELVYEPCERTPVCSFVERASWVYQSSFSKTLAPGLRLGFLTASEDLFPHLMKLKQAADLHSSRVSQHLVMSLNTSAEYGTRLEQLRNAYRIRRNRFAELLDSHFADLAEWTIPSGGLFFWLNLKSARPIDTRTLLATAVSQNVAFMPGEPFYANRPAASSALRLNFSHAGDEAMERGLVTLAGIIRQAIAD